MWPSVSYGCCGLEFRLWPSVSYQCCLTFLLWPSVAYRCCAQPLLFPRRRLQLLTARDFFSRDVTVGFCSLIRLMFLTVDFCSLVFCMVAFCYCCFLQSSVLYRCILLVLLSVAQGFVLLHSVTIAFCCLAGVSYRYPQYYTMHRNWSL